MKSLITFCIFALSFICSLSLAELLYIPEVKLIARQADFICKGVVLENQKMQINKQYKGEIESKLISVPELKEVDSMIKNWLKEDSHINSTIQKAIGDEKHQILKESGLIGSTIVVFLQRDKDDVFSLKGTCLNSPEKNYKHAAIKLVCGEKVFGFSQIKNPDLYGLIMEHEDVSKLEANIAYDRPLLFKFGFACATNGGEVYNYLYFAITNLSKDRVAINFPEDALAKIIIDGVAVALPKENWRVLKPKGFEGLLLPVGEISAHYELTNIKNGAPPSIKLQPRKKYDVTLTIITKKDGIEDKYVDKTTAEIRPN